MDFATKLRKLMRAQRYSQDMLARRLDVSQNLVSRWTRGKSLPDLRTGVALAELFGVELRYLADDRLDEPENGVLEPRALDLIRDLGAAEAWRRLIRAPEPAPGQVVIPRRVEPPRDGSGEKRGAG